MSYDVRCGCGRPQIAMIVASELSLIFFRGQIRYLREAGFDVTCISSPGPEQERARAEGARVVTVEIPRAISPGRDLVALFRLWRVLRELRPEIVNCGTPKAGLLGGVAAWMARVPHRVYTLHGLRMETANGWQRRLLTATERIACACANTVRAVSPSLCEQAVALGAVPAGRVSVLGAGSANGIDTAVFHATDERRRAARQLRARLGIADDAQVLGFVGRITRDKGIRELEASFLRMKERFPKLVLLLIGGAEGVCREDKEIIARWRSDRQTVMLALDAATELTEYYLLMDVLLLPTYREGLGNVLLEAQAMEVPVVTTCVTGARDALRNGSTGFAVPVHDVEALVRATECLLADPARSRAMGEAGRAWVESTFSCETVWRLLEQDYRRILGGERDDEAAGEGQATFYMRHGKRWLDVGVSALMLLVLSPLLVLLLLMVRLGLGSPAIFRQRRPGRNGVEFTLVKFRTMADAADGQGELLADAERLNGFGRLLRSTSMDELPELWNVLRGEMSLVGPRPLLPEYLSLYSEEQRQRHTVRPGITGWAQVNGRNQLSWQRRLELDVQYARRPRLIWDLRILMLTLRQALLREGVSHEGHATMPKFRGAESD